MNGFPHLSNAPIREALFDFQLTMPEGTSIENLENFGELVKDDYPGRRKKWSTQLRIIPGKTPTKVTQDQVGCSFLSADEKQVLQLRIDGFAFSRLRPYTDWGSLRGEAHRLWSLFIEYLTPISVDRIACRFINELHIKMPIQLDHVLVSTPARVKGLPDLLESFLTKVVVPIEELDSHVRITQALEQLKPNGEGNVLLDIDAYKLCDYTPQNDEIWRDLDQFRDLKNNIFFGSVTKQAIEGFK